MQLNFFEMSVRIEQHSLHQTIHQELNLHPVKVQSLVSSAQGKYNKELMIQIEGRQPDLVQIKVGTLIRMDFFSMTTSHYNSKIFILSAYFSCHLHYAPCVPES